MSDMSGEQGEPPSVDGGSSASVDAGDDAGQSRGQVVAHDISILYPTTPLVADVPFMVKADSPGTGGDLIPASTYDLLPQLRLNPRRPNARDQTLVFGVRANCDFDPRTPHERCHGQLQLSLQLVAEFGPALPDGGTGTFNGEERRTSLEDASMHAIYALGDAEFEELVRELVALREANGGVADEALGVHPLLKQQGLAGPFARGLATIVLKHAGQRTLQKVTFITIETPGTVAPPGQEAWKFGVFEKVQGRFQRVTIPTLDAGIDEQLVHSTFGQSLASEFAATVRPSLPREGDISALFGTLTAPTPDQQAAASRGYDLALQIENPLKRSPHDTDCASCHLTHSRIRGEEVFRLSSQTNSNAFAAGALTTTVPVLSPSNVRAFGYGVLGRPRQTEAASISVRVVNETAYTLQYLNR